MGMDFFFLSIPAKYPDIGRIHDLQGDENSAEGKFYPGIRELETTGLNKSEWENLGLTRDSLWALYRMTDGRLQAVLGLGIDQFDEDRYVRLQSHSADLDALESDIQAIQRFEPSLSQHVVDVYQSFLRAFIDNARAAIQAHGPLAVVAFQ